MSVAPTIDTPVLVNGVQLALIQTSASGHRDVCWQVYGPQRADMAIDLCKAIIEALGGVTPSSQADSYPESKEGVRPRSYTKAIREEIQRGLSDDEIWEKLRVELNLTNDKRYRIKEVRREGSTHQVM